MAVDALFKRRKLDDFVQGELARFIHFTFDGNGPGRRLEFSGVFRGIGFVGAEFVEIVVVGDIVIRILPFRGAEWTFDEVVEFRGGERFRAGGCQIPQTRSGQRGGSGDAHAAEEFAPIEIERFRGDIGIRQIWCLAD